jgi:hypothetical protein
MSLVSFTGMRIILMRGPPLPPPERPPLGVFGAALNLRNPKPGETLNSDKP